MQLPYQFGKYVLLKKIAQGGMAEIYKAKYYGERGFAKDIAVKRILPVWAERKDLETMLVDEAKALVHLQHQNIVQVFELGRDGEFFYISMEYVDGVDLKRLYKKAKREGGGIPERFACFIIVEVLKALEFAHRQVGDDGALLNIVHRDVSPQNVLLSYNGEVKLTDFGIAKGLHRDQETTTAQLKGKYSYMSPEQAMGKPIDYRSDLYSVGIVLYEILTGSRLFTSDSDFDTIQNARESKMPEGWEARVSLNMRNILKKALASDVDARYQTAADFIRDLNAYVSFKKIFTHGLEFSDYLNQLFSEERFDEVEPEVAPQRETKILEVDKTIEENYGRAPPLRSRYAALIILCMPLLISGFSSSGRGGDGAYQMSIQSSPETVAELPKPPKKTVDRSPPLLRGGIVNIDSIPSGASVTLESDGVRKEFETPLVWSDVRVDEFSEAKVTLRKTGYGTVTDNFMLSKENPVFNRTYELESITPGKLSIHARPWGFVYIPGVLSKRESPVQGIKLKSGRYQVKVHYAPTNSWAQAGVTVKPGHSHKCFADFSAGKKMWCK